MPQPPSPDTRNAPSESEHAAPAKSRLRHHLHTVWQAWKPRLLLAEYALLTIAIVAALRAGAWRENLTAIWIALNGVYSSLACVWVILHGRAVWKTRDSVLRWAICLSALCALLAYTIQYNKFAPLNASSTITSVGSFGVIVLLFIWFALFCGLMLIGLMGATVGSFAGRSSGNSERSARIGITLSMLSAVALLFALVFLPGTTRPDEWGLALLSGSFPLLTRLYVQTLQRSALPVRHWLRPVHRIISICLIWRWHVPARHFRQRWPMRKAMYVLDLRGATLGLVIAVLLLNVPPRYVGPLQSQALTMLTQLRVGVDAQSSRMPFLLTSSETTASTTHAREPFVILRMDAQTRYNAAQRSEAVVQAEMVERLQKWGVKRIVLPLPYLHGRMAPAWTSQEEGLAPDEQDVEHNRRDAPWLARLLHRSPHTLLTVPAGARPDDARVKLLTEAAAGVGTSDLERSETTYYLPVVPARWRGRPPVAALLCAQLKAANTTTANTSLPQRLRDIPGCARPRVIDGGVLIDFIGSGPREDFLHATYADVRANAPLLSLAAADQNPASHNNAERTSTPPPPPARPNSAKASPPHTSDGKTNVSINAVGQNGENSPQAENANHRKDKPGNESTQEKAEGARGEWKPAYELLRDRVVFLDSLAHPLILTPAGIMSQAEAQAYAASTLLSQEAFERTSRLPFILLTLLLGATVGYTCARHEPLDAGIRLLVPLFLVIAGSIATFLWEGQWFDPVVPLLTLAAAAAFATQFRFSRERADKQRTSELFGRFVAPHMVQAWLEQHEEELGLGGIREKICVLFADVRQFTPFAERNDATVVIDVINAYMTALTDALHAHGGILDKYTGDGLMAFFQVTHSTEEDLARAVQAALAMQKAVQALSAQQEHEDKPALELGLTLHYGDAIVGLVGNPRQQVNYTAIGLTVVVAARLQAIAAGGDVIVSEEVFLETQDKFEFVAGEAVQVKGLTQPVRPYRVLAARTVGDESLR